MNKALINKDVEFNDKSKEKLRGLGRRRENLIKTLHEMTEQLPYPSDYGLGYWHLHLPFDQGFIN